MTPTQLEQILVLLKQYEVEQYDSPELKITMRQPTSPLKPITKSAFSPTAQRQGTLLQRSATDFPESKYHTTLSSPDITPEELQVLGFAGVIPGQSPTEIKKRRTRKAKDI